MGVTVAGYHALSDVNYGCRCLWWLVLSQGTTRWVTSLMAVAVCDDLYCRRVPRAEWRRLWLSLSVMICTVAGYHALSDVAYGCRLSVMTCTVEGYHALRDVAYGCRCLWWFVLSQGTTRWVTSLMAVAVCDDLYCRRVPRAEGRRLWLSLSVMICTVAGYYALSDIAYGCRWCGWPKPEAYKSRVRCVHADLAEECYTTLAPIWTNRGGYERTAGSVWGVEVDEGVDDTGFWFGSATHSTQPQDGRAHCLRRFEQVDD